jgi:hypothetical protein
MRKPKAAEITEALRSFPHDRFEAIICDHLAQLYRSIRKLITAQLDEVVACKLELEQAAAAVEAPLAPAPLSQRRLMPPGCLVIGDAVERVVGTLTDRDQAEIEHRVQAALEVEIGGMFQACLSSPAGARRVVAILREQIREYLDRCIGETDLAAMLGERFGNPSASERAISEAYGEAEPAVAGDGPWAASQVVVVAAPTGPVQELARRAIPVAGLPIVDSRDDLTIYREYPAVPWSALPHLGPQAAALYHSLPESNQCSLHARLDVMDWRGGEVAAHDGHR